MSYDYGRFVWFELNTHDKDAALRFYPEVIGWKTSSMDMPGMPGGYSMVNVGETPYGGIVDSPVPDVPPHWVSYVSVADVDATAKAVIEHGGKCLMDAMDIPGVGRMQPVADPEGAAFVLFTNASEDSDALEGDGSFHWNELWSKDPEAQVAFYEKALGYTSEVMEMPNGKYFMLKNGEQSRGGIMKSPVDAPTHWEQYVRVDDVDAARTRATGNGGKALGDVMEVPGIGRFSLIADPTGATLGVITPEA